MKKGFNLSLVVAGLAALAWGIFLSRQGRALQIIPESPAGILSYEIAAHRLKLEQINAVWENRGLIPVAQKNVLLDYGFLIAYSLFFAVGIHHFVTQNGAYLLQRHRPKLIALALLPGLLDAVENIFLFQWLHYNLLDGWPAFIFSMVTLKFILAGGLALVCTTAFIRNLGTLIRHS